MKKFGEKATYERERGEIDSSIVKADDRRAEQSRRRGEERDVR